MVCACSSRNHFDAMLCYAISRLALTYHSCVRVVHQFGALLCKTGVWHCFWQHHLACILTKVPEQYTATSQPTASHKCNRATAQVTCCLAADWDSRQVQEKSTHPCVTFTSKSSSKDVHKARARQVDAGGHAGGTEAALTAGSSSSSAMRS